MAWTMLSKPVLDRALVRSGATAPLALALSGGGDSVALLHALVDAVGPARILALVVDHALRQGSDVDAHRAQSFALALGVKSEVLQLGWPNGPKRSQEGARVGRHRALADAARRAGARVLLLAHTSDDQAETLMMRAAAGSTWRGLAAMAAWAPSPVWPQGRGLMIARPLLDVRRERLREYLRAHSAVWIDDPANADEAFQRVRTRARLAAFEARGLAPSRLVRVAARLRRLADRVDREALGLIERAVRFENEEARLTLAAWRAPRPVAERSLSVLLMAVSGAEAAPESAALMRLAGEIGAPEFRGATLGGARVKPAGQGHLLLLRDVGALAGRADGGAPLAPWPLPMAATSIWDGRLALRAPRAGMSLLWEGAPVLAEGDRRLPLALASPEWLLGERVRHMLSRD